MNFPKYIQLLSLALTATITTGCDEGKIYPDEHDVAADGWTVTVRGSIKGCGSYENTDYGIVVAAFKDGEEYAVVSKPLTDGEEGTILKNIDTSVSTVEICVISRLREKVITIASMPLDQKDGRGFTFDVGELNVAPFSIINHNILATSCVQCHGATGTAAASLTLTETEAYSNLVNAASTVVEGEYRVAPGDATASTLWQAMATDISEEWKFDHSNLLTPEKSGFIKEWIDNGAENL